MDEKIKNKILEKMSKKRGCPLCSLISDHELSVLSKLQYLINHEEKIRIEIAVEGGYCDFHFRQFKKIANGKTNIILLKTILEYGVFNADYKIQCRICKLVDDFEKNLIKTGYELLKNEKFRNKFTAMPGLCFPHLKEVTKLCTKDLSEKVWEINAVQFKQILHDFTEMQQIKSFYEIDRWKRDLINIFIEKLAGRRTRGL
jgi:hypothetical protein